MATSTISNTITDPTGAAIANVVVTATLMPTAGFRSDTFTEVARTVSTTSNGSGAWSLALERNANITPANSWYEVVEQIPSAQGGIRVWNVAVGATNQTLLASLVTPADQQPTVVPAGTSYLTQAAADARYQALGSLSSGTPGQDSQTAGSAGVATSASRSDHVHQDPTATPRGTLGYASVVSNQGSITTEVDLTGLTTTVTVGSGRRIKVTGFANFSNATAGDGAFLLVDEGATRLATAQGFHATAGQGFSLTASVILTPSAGAHTYKLSATQQLGGTVTMVASSTAPAFILVEDIGV